MSLKNNNRFFVFLIAILIMSHVVTLFNTIFLKVYLFGILPLLCLSCFILFKNQSKDPILRRYFIFAISFILISFFGIDIHNSLDRLPTFIETLMVVYVYSKFSQDRRFLYVLLAYYILYLAACWYLGFTRYSFSEIDYTSERAEGVGLNANRFPPFTLFATLIVFLAGEFARKKVYKTIFRLLFLLFPFVAFGTAIMTGSRQVLILSMPILALLLIYRYFKSLNIKSIVFSILFIFVFLFVGTRLLDTYNSSYLAFRSTGTIKDDGRTYLIQTAIDVGINNWMTGVGMANLGYFTGGAISHCTFTDIFAEGGLFVLLIYILLLWKYCQIQIRRFKTTRLPVYKLFILFGIIYFVMNIFYVYYHFDLLMAFLFVMSGWSNIIYADYQNECSV